MNIHHQKGVVLLFAMLAIGLLIGIGVAISGLTQKQLVLSSVGKQSQVAFYAAESGAECARYWDLTNNVFIHADDPSDIHVTCDGQTPLVTQNSDPITTQSVITNFQYDLSSPPGFTDPSGRPLFYDYCASVTVTKNADSGAITIISRGYNLPCITPSTPEYSSRRVERAVQLTY